MPLELTGMCPLLAVFDMPTSVRFYRDLLGFAVLSTSPALGAKDDFHWVMLGRDGFELMLNTAYDTEDRPEVPDSARVRVHEDMTLYFGCPDADVACGYLRGSGLQMRDPRTAWYGMRQLYFKDPDGYGICLQHRV